jgi:hypothetical protein
MALERSSGLGQKEKSTRDTGIKVLCMVEESLLCAKARST